MIHVCVFGTGGFARKHAEIYASFDNVKIVAFCATNMEKAESAAKPFGAKAFDDAATMLDTCHPDAAIICVPPFAHGEIEWLLIERNIPFFIEKPIGLYKEEVDRITEAIQEKGLITSTGYHMRYLDGSLRAKELIQGKKILLCNGLWLGSFPGVYWWGNQKLSGGQFVEQTTHLVDLMRYYCGEADEVYAQTAYHTTSPGDEDKNVSDAGTMMIKFKNGVIATMSNTCVMPGYFPFSINVITSEGQMHVKGDGLKLYDGLGKVIEQLENTKDPYYKENAAFIHAIRTGDTSGILSSYEDGAKTLKITLAANESADKGFAVKL